MLTGLEERIIQLSQRKIISSSALFACVPEDGRKIQLDDRQSLKNGFKYWIIVFNGGSGYSVPVTCQLLACVNDRYVTLGTYCANQLWRSAQARYDRNKMLVNDIDRGISAILSRGLPPFVLSSCGFNENAVSGWVWSQQTLRLTLYHQRSRWGVVKRKSRYIRIYIRRCDVSLSFIVAFILWMWACWG